MIKWQNAIKRGSYWAGILSIVSTTSGLLILPLFGAGHGAFDGAIVLLLLPGFALVSVLLRYGLLSDGLLVFAIIFVVNYFLAFCFLLISRMLGRDKRS